MKPVASLLLASTLWLAPFAAGAADTAIVRPSPEAIEIYGAFLDQFLADNGSANLGRQTSNLSADNLRDFSDRVRGVHFLPPANNPQWLADSALNRRKRIRFVDAEQWQGRDPHKAIQRGEKIADAVSEGFKAGLLELSAIAFDEQHKTAMLIYSFSCGSLCGNGGPAFFDKTAHGWKRHEVNCGGWIS